MFDRLENWLNDAGEDMDLQDQNKGMDYARSQSGQFLLIRCLNLTSAAIEQEMQACLKGVGHGSALVGEVYADISDKQLVNLSRFDRDGRPTTEMTRKREKSAISNSGDCSQFHSLCD